MASGLFGRLLCVACLLRRVGKQAVSLRSGWKGSERIFESGAPRGAQVTELPDSVVLEGATLSIDAVFTTPRLAALRSAGAAPSAAAQAAASAGTPTVGTKDVQVALPPPTAVGTYDGAGAP